MHIPLEYKGFVHAYYFYKQLFCTCTFSVACNCSLHAYFRLLAIVLDMHISGYWQLFYTCIFSVPYNCFVPVHFQSLACNCILLVASKRLVQVTRLFPVRMQWLCACSVPFCVAVRIECTRGMASNAMQFVNGIIAYTCGTSPWCVCSPSQEREAKGVEEVVAISRRIVLLFQNRSLWVLLQADEFRYIIPLRAVSAI